MLLEENLVLSVTELNRYVKSWLEQEVKTVCVEGEISNLSKPSSGHYYFTLKDAGAQLRCVCFRGRRGNNTEELWLNGKKIVVSGQLTLYEARGDYQLIVESVRESGLGDLFLQFEALKKKLAAEGLFDAALKQPLPLYPRCIGIITSFTAAALQDVLTTLARRYPLAAIIVYSSDVQGAAAARKLQSAVVLANKQQRCDVLILARGGGSIEDLWCFNDEALARAIFASKIPIISGVGHETDTTIVDFVADKRAATPTAAAEAVTPNRDDLLVLLDKCALRLVSFERNILHKYILKLENLTKRIPSLQKNLDIRWQNLDYLSLRLHIAIKKITSAKQTYLTQLMRQVELQHPSIAVEKFSSKLSLILVSMVQTMQNNLQKSDHQLNKILATLNVVSPLATLERGYAIALFENKVIKAKSDVKMGDIIQLRLAQGLLSCAVV
jgi:exodeoxyribonuclease VII large subunit